MDRAVWTSAAIGFAIPVVLLSPLNAARAGFLDWLFAPRKPAVTRPLANAAAHPDVTVGTRRVARKRVAAKVVRGERTPARRLDPKEQLARTIDPDKRPDWYLIDPTIRKGDVLFLRNRVLVYKGSRLGDARSYVPVSQSRELSRKERRLLEAMAPARGEAAPVASRPAPGRSVASAADPSGLRAN